MDIPGAEHQADFYHNNRISVPLYSRNETKPDTDLRLGVFTKHEDCIFITIYSAIAILGFLLNLVAIIVISTGRKTSKEIKVQLINLAVADMISSLIFPGYMLHFELKLAFPPSLTFCRLVLLIGKGSFYTTLLWNTIISVERFVVVYFPFKAARYTQSCKLAVAAAVWACGFLITTEIAIYANLEKLRDGVICIVASPLLIKHPVIFEFRAAAKYSLPAIIIFAMYSLIAIKLAKTKFIGETSKSTNASSYLQKRNRQVLTMLAIDSGLTIVTWLPYSLSYAVTEAIGVENYSRRQLMLIATILGAVKLSSCFTSPIIYYIFNRAFRADTHDLFRRICAHNQKEDCLPNIAAENAKPKSVQTHLSSESARKEQTPMSPQMQTTSELRRKH